MNILKLLRIIYPKLETEKELFDWGKKWVSDFKNNGCVKDGDRILDYGAGMGRLSKYFNEFCEVVPIDANPGMVEYMKSIGLNPLLRNDCSRVKGRFDFAISLYVLQHIPFKKSQKIIGQISKLTDVFYFTYPLDFISDSYYYYKQEPKPLEDIYNCSHVSRSMSEKELGVLFEKSSFNIDTLTKPQEGKVNNFFRISK